MTLPVSQPVTSAAEPKRSSRPSKPAPKRPPGRPSLYDPRYVEIARQAAQRGALDRHLIALFGLSPATLYNWKRDHPEFAEAIRRGVSDGMRRHFVKPDEEPAVLHALMALRSRVERIQAESVSGDSRERISRVTSLPKRKHAVGKTAAETAVETAAPTLTNVDTGAAGSTAEASTPASSKVLRNTDTEAPASIAETSVSVGGETLTNANIDAPDGAPDDAADLLLKVMVTGPAPDVTEQPKIGADRLALPDPPRPPSLWAMLESLK